MAAGLVVALAGCNRAHYRCQADKEVYGAVACATSDPRWAVPDFTIQPDPASRMYDPDNPDCPPMPPDDPDSQKLMHYVYGMRGWKYWHRDGDTPYTENPDWRAYLPRDADGVVAMDRQGAVQLALLHSREYQSELEQLYLSALQVTFQRFRFDTQFFGTFTTDYTTNANTKQNTLSQQNDLKAEHLFASGAEMIVGVANSLVWQLAGPESYQANTLLSYSLVQPLLRAGGRAVVLEGLTDAERAMLANIRQWEQYRRGFYLRVVAGRSTGPGPSQAGLTIGSLSPSSPAGLGGLLGLLGTQILIRNQKSNVSFVRTSLDQLDAFFEANRIDRLQLEQTRQSLLSNERSLLSQQIAYENQLDSFKILLGLPPDLEIRIADPLLNRFDLIAPSLTALRDKVSAVLTPLRQKERPLTGKILAELSALAGPVRGQTEKVQSDLQKLAAALPARRKNLALLAQREEVRSGSVDPTAFDVRALDLRTEKLAQDYPKLVVLMRTTLQALDQAIAIVRSAPKPAPKAGGETVDKPRQQLTVVVEDLADELLQLSLVQAAARLDTVSLVWVDLGPEEGFRTAQANRPDWMNARAALVDNWRQIEVTANALQGGLNLTVNGDLNTIGNNPVKFSSTTGQLFVGVQLDAPLTRVVERNAYRAALIAYQQNRRQYYAFEDQIDQTLRAELRDVRNRQIDFELSRAAVFVAIMQLDLNRLKLQQPPAPGQMAVFGATTARDLLDALAALLAAQDDFLTGWLNYEIERMNLDFDLGTMRLDDNGMWIDPGPVQSGQVGPAATPAEPPEPIPPPPPPAARP